MPSSEPSTVPQGWFHRCWSSAARPVLGAKPHNVYCICISQTHKVSVQAKTLQQSFPHGTSSPEPFLPLNHHGLQLSLVWCCLSSLQIHERKWPKHLQQSAATQPHLSSLLKLSPPHPLPIPSFSLAAWTQEKSRAQLFSIRNYLLPSGRGGREALILTKARLALCSTPHSLVFL